MISRMHYAGAMLVATMASAIAGCTAPTADVASDAEEIAASSSAQIDCEANPEDPRCPEAPARGGRLPCAVCATAIGTLAYVTVAAAPIPGDLVDVDLRANGQSVLKTSVPAGTPNYPVQLPAPFVVPTVLEVVVLTPFVITYGS